MESALPAIDQSTGAGRPLLRIERNEHPNGRNDATLPTGRILPGAEEFRVQRLDDGVGGPSLGPIAIPGLGESLLRRPEVIGQLRPVDPEIPATGWIVLRADGLPVSDGKSAGISLRLD